MSTDHIIFRSPSSEGYCLHCGDCYKFKLPMSIKNLGQLIDAFMTLHADCTPFEQPKVDIPAHKINRT